MARANGLITGWMPNRKRGAPLKIKPAASKTKKKKKKTQGTTSSARPNTAALTNTNASTAPNAASTSTASASADVAAPSTGKSKRGASVAAATAPSTGKSKRGRKHSAKASKSAQPYPKAIKRPYTNWNVNPFKSALDRAVNATLKGLNGQEAAGDILIPPSTLRRRIKEAEEAAAKKGKDAVVYLDEFRRGEKVAGKMLTSEETRDYLQELIVLRDLKNNPMTRGEVIGTIQMMCFCDFKTAENHWYYLRRKKLLPECKNHGALRSAQATTTKRSGVTTEKLMRWHGNVDAALRELDRLNSWHPDWQGIKESKKLDSFWGNMDETNMSASEGKYLN